MRPLGRSGVHGTGMTLGLIAGLGIVVALIVLNGVYVAGEFCLLAVDTSQVDVLAGQGQLRARGVRSLLRRLNFHLAGAQLGITLTSLVLGIIAEDTVGRLIEWALGGWGLLAGIGRGRCCGGDRARRSFSDGVR